MTDWRVARLDHLRSLIEAAIPDVVEEVKWRKPSNPDGVPVWSRNGIICTGETYKDKVKLTFMKGGQLDDLTGLFVGDGVRRAIDLHEDTDLDDDAFKAVVRAAADLNGGG